MTKNKEDLITWPRLHKPHLATWLCEFGLLLDSAIFVATFSIVETNFFCALIKLVEGDDNES